MSKYSKCVLVLCPSNSLAGVWCVAEWGVLRHNNKKLFINDLLVVLFFLKTFFMILTPDSAAPLVSGWNGTPTKCLYPH